MRIRSSRSKLIVGDELSLEDRARRIGYPENQVNSIDRGQLLKAVEMEERIQEYMNSIPPTETAAESPEDIRKRVEREHIAKQRRNGS